MTCQIVTAESLPTILWNQTPVVTTELLSQLYGTDAHNIIKNYASNADRFIEGKHFFKLEGQSLRDFKNCITQSDSVQIAKHTRNLTLWTERGAARHAKMLDTEQAWEVFEKLEDCYFKAPTTITPAQQLQIRKAIAKVARKPDEFKAAYRRLHDEFNVSKFDQLPADKFLSALDFIASLEGEYFPKQEPANALPELPDRAQLLKEAIAEHLGGVRMILTVDLSSLPALTPIAPDALVFAPHELPKLISSPEAHIPKTLLPKIIEAVAERMKTA